MDQPSKLTPDDFPFSSQFVLDTPRANGKSSGGSLLSCSIGVSPPPGTPEAAPFGYRSIIVLCTCHRPGRWQSGFYRVG